MRRGRRREWPGPSASVGGNLPQFSVTPLPTLDKMFDLRPGRLTQPVMLYEPANGLKLHPHLPEQPQERWLH